MADSATDSGLVFISYSHADRAYLARLQQHLAPHVRSGAIPLWDDTHIKPGDDWMHSIEQALDAARVALLLVSVDFMASEFVTNEELPRLLAAAEARGTRIMPIVLTPCSFRRGPLSRFQAINDPARPLSGLRQHRQDVEWERVVEVVLDTIAAPVAVSIVGQHLLSPRLERLSDVPLPAPVPARARRVKQSAASNLPKQGKLLFNLKKHSGRELGVAWAPDGTKLAAASADATVRIWETSSRKLLVPYQGHVDWVFGVAWAPDSIRLASAGADRTVRVWGVESKNLLFTCRGHKHYVNSVTWAPDGRRLASASNDGTVRVWEASKGELIFTYEGHERAVNSVAWSPDGEWLASASNDGTIQVWAWASGHGFFSYQEPEGPTGCATS